MADSVLSKEIIVNWARADLGLAPKFDFSDESEFGQLVAVFWPRCEARAIALHDWTFCRLTRRCTRQVATPENGWAHAHDLPGDRIGPPLKLLSDPQANIPLRNFDIEGNTVFSREPVVYARCKVRVAPEAWPAEWADAFAKLLASYFAVPLLQDTDIAAQREYEAVGRPSEGGTGGIFGRLIAQDRAGQPLGQPLTDADPLSAARWHGRW